MRFVPTGWSYGHRSSASSGSCTRSRILLAQELGQQVVGGRIGEEVGVRRVEAEPADGVALLELALALLGGRVPDALLARVPRIAGRGRARHAAVDARSAPCARLIASASSGAFQAGTLKFAVRWNTVRCAASAAMIGIACTAEEPVPITPTRLPANVDALVRPEAGVVHLAREALDPGDVGDARNREAARRHDQEGRGEPVAVVGGDRPAVAPSSSKAASATRVPSRMSRRRSKRSATCSR